MQHLKTPLEILAEQRYPYPEKCCRLKKMSIDEKRKLYIQRLINESQSDNHTAEKR